MTYNKMSDQQKIDSAKWVLMPRWRVLIQNWTIIIAIMTAFVYGVRKDGLTFDSPEQKRDVINHIDPRPDAIKIHLTQGDRDRLIRFETRQDAVLEELMKINKKLDNLK